MTILSLYLLQGLIGLACLVTFLQDHSGMVIYCVIWIQDSIGAELMQYCTQYKLLLNHSLIDFLLSNQPSIPIRLAEAAQWSTAYLIALQNNPPILRSFFTEYSPQGCCSEQHFNQLLCMTLDSLWYIKDRTCLTSCILSGRPNIDSFSSNCC